jgi:signal transduction histidine kinase
VGDAAIRPHPYFRLSRLMIALLSAIALAALVSGVALNVIATLERHHATRLLQLGDAKEAVQRVHAQVQRYSWLSNYLLVTHDTKREEERTRTMQEVFRSLGQIHEVAAPSQASQVDQVEADVRSYFAARLEADQQGMRPENALVAITPALDRLEASGRELARSSAQLLAAERVDEERWQAYVRPIGWGIAGLVVLGSVALLLAVYRTGFRPLFALVETMRRFASGQRDVRMGDGESVELAQAGGAFNEMADVITQTHSRMLDFLGSATAKLKGPVHVMQTALAGIPVQAKVVDDKVRSRLRLVNHELDQLDALVDTFLDVSRVEWQRMDLQLEHEDLRREVIDAVKLYETFSSTLQFMLHVPDEPVSVAFDRGRLPQVLHALLANAIHLSRGGGVIHVTLEAHRTEALLTLTDPGVTLSEPELKELFAAFRPFRSIEGQRLPGGATWVALSVARRIVEAHGGRIESESAAGRGTTIRVYLPLVSSGESSPAR